MENGMMDSKQTVIGNLYAIRAGLSYVSGIADQMKKKQEEEKELNFVLTSHRTKIQSLQDSIEETEKEIRNWRNRESVLKQELEKKKQEQNTLEYELENSRSAPITNFESADDSSSYSYKHILKLFIIASSIFFAVTAVLGVLIAVGQGGVASIFVYPEIGLLVFFIVRTVKFAKKRKELREAKKNYISHHEYSIKTTRREISRLEEDISDTHRSIPDKTRELEESIQQRYLQIKREQDEIPKCQYAISQCQSQYKALREKGQVFTNGLVSAYGDFCHRDNWQHIDRILYYLNTGRAESLRDALILMDQRLNAEMIANEIRQSFVMISGEIQRATASITSAVSLSADRISAAVYDAGERITSSNQRIEETMARSNDLAAKNLETNQRLVSAQELNNALQHKSNATMEQLMNDYATVNGLRY